MVRIYKVNTGADIVIHGAYIPSGSTVILVGEEKVVKALEREGLLKVLKTYEVEEPKPTKKPTKAKAESAAKRK